MIPPLIQLEEVFAELWGVRGKEDEIEAMMKAAQAKILAERQAEAALEEDEEEDDDEERSISKAESDEGDKEGMELSEPGGNEEDEEVGMDLEEAQEKDESSSASGGEGSNDAGSSDGLSKKNRRKSKEDEDEEEDRDDQQDDADDEELKKEESEEELCQEGVRKARDARVMKEWVVLHGPISKNHAGNWKEELEGCKTTAAIAYFIYTFVCRCISILPELTLRVQNIEMAEVKLESSILADVDVARVTGDVPAEQTNKMVWTKIGKNAIMPAVLLRPIKVSLRKALKAKDQLLIRVLGDGLVYHSKREGGCTLQFVDDKGEIDLSAVHFSQKRSKLLDAALLVGKELMQRMQLASDDEETEDESDSNAATPPKKSAAPRKNTKTTKRSGGAKTVVKKSMKSKKSQTNIRVTPSGAMTKERTPVKKEKAKGAKEKENQEIVKKTTRRGAEKLEEKGRAEEIKPPGKDKVKDEKKVAKSTGKEIPKATEEKKKGKDAKKGKAVSVEPVKAPERKKPKVVVRERRRPSTRTR